MRNNKNNKMKKVFTTLDIRELWIPNIPQKSNGHDLVYDYYRLYELSRIYWDKVKVNDSIPFAHIVMSPEQATALQYLTVESRLLRPTFHGAIIKVK